jgi:hypothetical protein
MIHKTLSGYTGSSIFKSQYFAALEGKKSMTRPAQEQELLSASGAQRVQKQLHTLEL